MTDSLCPKCGSNRSRREFKNIRNCHECDHNYDPDEEQTGEEEG